MGITASSTQEPEKEEYDSNEEEERKEDIPSVFVNYEFLNFDKQKGDGKVYEINGKMYTDNLRHEEEFVEFKLHADRIGEREEEIDNNSKKREFNIQEVDNGFIIDSCIFVNVHHYNTLINIFDDCLNCFVCDDIVLNENCGSHIETEDHRRNLSTCPIVEEFNKSIFRMKNGHYHCGLCNVVFHKNSSRNHFKGQTHANNKILSTKQAENIMKVNSGRNRNNDAQNGNNDNELKDDNEMYKDNIAVDGRVSVKTKKKTFKISFYTWNMIVISKDNAYYCMACKLKDSIDNLTEHIKKISHKGNLEEFKINELYENHLIRQNAKWSHCGTCNTVHYLGGTDLHIVRHDKGKTFTQSAKTIVISDNGNNANGHENNDDKNKNNDDKNENNNNRNINNDSPSTSKAMMNINLNANDIVKAIVNDKCNLNLFGLFNIQVSYLSLNAIFYNQMGFFRCAFCNVDFTPTVLHNHVTSLVHNTLLNSTPAIPHYGYNYVRSINNLLHCGICHLILLQPNMILYHLQDPNHIRQANIALGLVNLPPQPQNAISTANVHDNKNLQKDNNIINEVNTDTDIINANKIDDVKNVINENKVDDINGINERKNTNNDETKNVIDTSVQREKEDVYIEVIKRKILDIESKYAEDITGIFDAVVEVLTKKARMLVSWTSFNTLVPIGDGDRYCFACGVRVETEMMKNHISTKSHMECIKDRRFLEEYCNNLIRQNGYLYHCALCNAILRQPELNNHIEWTTHEGAIKLNKINVNKKQRNSIDYQKQVFPTDQEVIINKTKNKNKDVVHKWSYTIKPNDPTGPTKKIVQRDPTKNCYTLNTDHKEMEGISFTNDDLKKNKIIIIDDLDVKILLKRNAWHSIITTKNKYKCIICNEKLNSVYVDFHINSASHAQKLDKPFMTNYYPSLIRKVNADMLHCSTCNTVLYHNANIQTHIKGERHKRCLEDLIVDKLDDDMMNEDIIIV